MPTYRITAPALCLTGARCQALAEAITQCHHEATGAPRYFVQVLFEPVLAEHQYVGGAAPEVPQIFIAGTIRSGRAATQKRELMAGLVAATVTALDVLARQVWVYLAELAPEQMVEFGLFLPEAGAQAEAAWFDALSDDQQHYMTAMDRRRR